MIVTLKSLIPSLLTHNDSGWIGTRKETSCWLEPLILQFGCGLVSELIHSGCLNKCTPFNQFDLSAIWKVHEYF
jgi:hypothetical protein